MNTGLSKYYKLFGLTENATQADIKKRYRKLAMYYHPDKFGGDNRKFIEIKEAYEYLIGKKTVIQSLQTQKQPSTRSTSQARQQTPEERIKQAKQRQQDSAYKEYIENERYFKNLTSGNKWKIIRASAILGTIITFTLLLEFFFPYRYENERIVAYDKENIGALESGSYAKKFYTESGKSYYVESLYSVILQSDPDVLLVKSALFHNELGIIPFYDTQMRLYKIQYTFGAHSLILVPIFLFPLLVVLFRRKTYTFTLFYFLSLYLSAPLTAYYLFSNDRWLHLLTLGKV
jgi:curved DNA-binding protein CbpA